MASQDSQPASQPLSVPCSPSREDSDTFEDEQPATRPKSKDLTRDTRLQVLTLHNLANFPMKKVAQILGITYNQVRHVVDTGHPTPKKRTGRKLTLSSEQVDELEQFICSSRRSRQMTYQELATGKIILRKMYLDFYLNVNL